MRRISILQEGHWHTPNMLIILVDRCGGENHHLLSTARTDEHDYPKVKTRTLDISLL
jgi:hypothetical protein